MQNIRDWVEAAKVVLDAGDTTRALELTRELIAASEPPFELLLVTPEEARLLRSLQSFREFANQCRESA